MPKTTIMDVLAGLADVNVASVFEAAAEISPNLYQHADYSKPNPAGQILKTYPSTGLEWESADDAKLIQANSKVEDLRYAIFELKEWAEEEGLKAHSIGGMTGNVVAAKMKEIIEHCGTALEENE